MLGTTHAYSRSMKTSGAAQARGKAATRPVVAMGLSRASRRTAETSGGAMTIAAAVGARRAASTTHGGNNSHMNTLRNGTKSRRGCSLKASEKNTHEYVQPQLSEVEEVSPLDQTQAKMSYFFFLFRFLFRFLTLCVYACVFSDRYY